MNMIEKRKLMAGQGGFTLIELLVVIAILAILAGAAIVGIGAMRTNAQKTACKSEKDTIETALEARDVDTNSTAATSTAIQSAIDSNYLKKTDAGDWITARSGNAWVVTADTGSGDKFAAVATDCNTP